jgi:two-component system response regulator HydG
MTDERNLGLLGESQAITDLRALIGRVAKSDASVLIVGETGTGKEVVAKELHRLSPRSAGPFVAINCAAVPESLLESELFGHERGAYTGAEGAREGLFQHANGGTLFLDEVGDMALSVQVRLLRVLQERRVRPLGGNREIPVDVRLVSATHFDLEDAVSDGIFREDLLYRVNVIRVDLPPLRARGDDVLLLARAFLELACKRSNKEMMGFSGAVTARLRSYDWPGNVRELRNCVERAVALTDGPEVLLSSLPSKIARYRGRSDVLAIDAVADLVPLEQLERDYILRVLELVRGNKTRAARILGVGRKTLYRKLHSYTNDSRRLPRLPLL